MNPGPPDSEICTLPSTSRIRNHHSCKERQDPAPQERAERCSGASAEHGWCQASQWTRAPHLRPQQPPLHEPCCGWHPAHLDTPGHKPAMGESQALMNSHRRLPLRRCSPAPPAWEPQLVDQQGPPDGEATAGEGSGAVTPERTSLSGVCSPVCHSAARRLQLSHRMRRAQSWKGLLGPAGPAPSGPVAGPRVPCPHSTLLTAGLEKHEDMENRLACGCTGTPMGILGTIRTSPSTQSQSPPVPFSADTGTPSLRPPLSCSPETASCPADTCLSR